MQHDQAYNLKDPGLFTGSFPGTVQLDCSLYSQRRGLADLMFRMPKEEALGHAVGAIGGNILLARHPLEVPRRVRRDPVPEHRLLVAVLEDVLGLQASSAPDLFKDLTKTVNESVFLPLIKLGHLSQSQVSSLEASLAESEVSLEVNFKVTRVDLCVENEARKEWQAVQSFSEHSSTRYS